MKSQRKRTHRKFSLTEINPEADIAVRKGIQKYIQAVRDDYVSGRLPPKSLPPEQRMRILD